MPSNSSRNVRAGGAFVELFMKDGQFNATLRNVGQKLKTFGMAASISGAAISGVGIAAASPFVKAVQTFASFDDAMAQVRANLNPTGEQFQKLQDEAERLGRTMKYTATEAAQAMYVLSVAGFSVEEIMGSLSGSLQLAAVGKMDLAEAADVTAKALRGLNLDASESSRVTDVLALGSVTANTTVQQLGNAFTYAAPFASRFGLSLEELTASIQIMSDAGIQGDMAGRTLRGAMLSMTSPTKETTAELDRLGISITDQAGKVRPLVDIMADLESAYRPMANGEMLESLGTIFPAEQISGIVAMISKGSDALRAKTEALQDAAGTAARISAQQMDSLVGDVVVAESTAEGFFIRLGRMFGPLLRTATQTTTWLISQATDWITANQETVMTVAKVLAGVIALGTGLTALGVSALAAGFVFSGLASVYGIVAGAIGLLFSPLAILSGLFAAVSTVTMAMLSPLGLTVGAIAGLVYWSGAGGEALQWLSEKFTWLSEMAGESFGVIKEALAAGEYQAAANVLWSALRLVWTQGTAWLSGLWRSMSGGFVETFKGTIEVIGEMWRSLIAGVESTLGKSYNKISGYLIEAQRMAGLLSDAEAAGAQEELANMGQESQDRIRDRLKREQAGADQAAEARREQAREEQAKAAQESAKAVADAQAEYDDAVAKADTKIWVKRMKDEIAKANGKDGKPGQGLPGEGDTRQTIRDMHAKTSPGGTFSSLASQIFGAGADQLQKDQLKELKHIHKAVEGLTSLGHMEWRA